jgi:photosystem II stability/assembly factor-like uncharacterized protein
MKRVAVLVILMLCSCPLRAQWVRSKVDPYGVNAFAIQHTTVFCCYAGFGGTGSIYRSEDTGNTWIKSDTGLGGLPVFSLFANDTLLLAGTYGGGILRSTNHGLTWIPADSMVYCSEILSFVSKGKYLFAGALKNMTGLVLRSSDGGRHWTETQRVPFGTYINSMVVKDSFVFASDWGDPTYRSSNYGDTWEGVDLPSEGCLFVKDSVILSSTAKGFFRSLDDGAHWIRVDPGPPSGVDCIVDDGRNVFACVARPSSVVCRSTDDGLTWRTINEGIDSTWHPNFEALIIAGTYLLAGSDSYPNVLRRPLSEFSAVRGDVPSGFALAQNYPNPFNPTTTFTFTLPKSAVVSLIVCDALGNEVGVVNSREMNSGEHHVTWDASSFASGIYTYRLEYGGFIQTKKLVILK